ncbi:MAG: response regulator, partial [Nitrococcus sp.]|nr:response regulator [Nitrococcus sp.]
MAVKILLVEDEAAIREMVAMVLLARGGYSVHQADSGEAGLALLEVHAPDLVLLDWMLPGMSGIEFARRLKKHPTHREIPIIILTARGEEEDKVRGLDVGADDFVTKPFSPRELLARIKAVLRRTASIPGDDQVKVDGLALDPVAHRAWIGEDTLEIGPTEFRLLRFFMTHPERVFSRAQLLDYVWGTNVYVEERTVDV